jgi:hypothetical protein
VAQETKRCSSHVLRLQTCYISERPVYLTKLKDQDGWVRKLLAYEVNGLVSVSGKLMDCSSQRAQAASVGLPSILPKTCLGSWHGKKTAGANMTTTSSSP